MVVAVPPELLGCRTASSLHERCGEPSRHLLGCTVPSLPRALCVHVTVLACISARFVDFLGQIITIIISEYSIPYPAVMDNLKESFSWANLNIFELVETGCKVCVLGLVLAHYWLMA
jgi:hypothetical protein